MELKAMETNKSLTPSNSGGHSRQWFTAGRGFGAICAVVAIGLLVVFLGDGAPGDGVGPLATLLPFLLILVVKIRRFDSCRCQSNQRVSC